VPCVVVNVSVIIYLFPSHSHGMTSVPSVP
jgi:hypothetical protein